MFPVLVRDDVIDLDITDMELMAQCGDFPALRMQPTHTTHRIWGQFARGFFREILAWGNMAPRFTLDNVTNGRNGHLIPLRKRALRFTLVMVRPQNVEDIPIGETGVMTHCPMDAMANGDTISGIFYIGSDVKMARINTMAMRAMAGMQDIETFGNWPNKNGIRETMRHPYDVMIHDSAITVDTNIPLPEPALIGMFGNNSFLAKMACDGARSLAGARFGTTGMRTMLLDAFGTGKGFAAVRIRTDMVIQPTHNQHSSLYVLLSCAKYSSDFGINQGQKQAVMED